MGKRRTQQTLWKTPRKRVRQNTHRRAFSLESLESRLLMASDVIGQWELVADTGPSNADRVTWDLRIQGQVSSADAPIANTTAPQPGATGTMPPLATGVAAVPPIPPLSTPPEPLYAPPEMPIGAPNPGLGQLPRTASIPSTASPMVPTLGEADFANALATSSIDATRVVEWDHDGDGQIDGVSAVGAEGRFVYEPQDVRYGALQLRARVVSTTSVVPGAWQTFNVHFVPQPAGVVHAELLNDTGTAGDRRTSDPRVAGQVRQMDGAPAPYAKVYIDVNQDGRVDEHLWTDADGQFVFDPPSLVAGSHTLQFRVGRWDARAGGEVFGDWRSIAFQFEPQVPLGVVQFEVFGWQDADTPVHQRGVQGTAAPGAEIELDLNSDGVPDRFGSADETGAFQIVGITLVPGRSTLRVRALDVNGHSAEPQASEWSSLSIDVKSNSFGAIQLDQLRLRTDDGQHNNDRLTSDPLLVGRVILPSSLAFGWIEFDTNGDQLRDGAAAIRVDGSFTVLPASEPGIHHVRVRTVTWDYQLGRAAAGPWQTLSYELQVRSDGEPRTETSSASSPSPTIAAGAPAMPAEAPNALLVAAGSLGAPAVMPGTPWEVSTVPTVPDLDAGEVQSRAFAWPEAPEIPEFDPWSLAGGSITSSGELPELLVYRLDLEMSYQRAWHAAQADYERQMRADRDMHRQQNRTREEQHRRDEQAAREAAAQATRQAHENYHRTISAAHPTIDLVAEQAAHGQRVQQAMSAYEQAIAANRAHHEQIKASLRDRLAHAERQAQETRDSIIRQMEQYVQQHLLASSPPPPDFPQRIQQYRRDAFTAHAEMIAQAVRDVAQQEADAENARQRNDARALEQRDRAIADSAALLARQQAEWWKWDAERQVAAIEQRDVAISAAELQQQATLANLEQQRAVKDLQLAEYHQQEQLEALEAMHAARAQIATLTSDTQWPAGDVGATVHFAMALLVEEQRLFSGIEVAEQSHSAAVALATARWNVHMAAAEWQWKQQVHAADHQSLVDHRRVEVQHALDVIAARYTEIVVSGVEWNDYERRIISADEQRSVEQADADRSRNSDLADLYLQHTRSTIPILADAQVTGITPAVEADLGAAQQGHVSAAADVRHRHAYAELDAEQRWVNSALDAYFQYEATAYDGAAHRATAIASADAARVTADAMRVARHANERQAADELRTRSELDAELTLVTDVAAADGARDATVVRLIANFEQAVQREAGQWEVARATHHVALVEQFAASEIAPKDWADYETAVAQHLHTWVTERQRAELSQVVDTTSADVDAALRRIALRTQTIAGEAAIARQLVAAQTAADSQQLHDRGTADVQAAGDAAAATLKFVSGHAQAGRDYQVTEAQARKTHEQRSHAAAFDHARRMADADRQRDKKHITASDYETFERQSLHAKRIAEAAAFEQKEYVMATAAEEWTQATSGLGVDYASATGAAAVDRAQAFHAAESNWFTTQSSATRTAADALEHSRAQADRQGLAIQADWNALIAAADLRLAADHQMTQLRFDHAMALAGSGYESAAWQTYARGLANESGEGRDAEASTAELLQYRAHVATAAADRAQAVHDAREQMFSVLQAAERQHLDELQQAERQAQLALNAAHFEYVNRITDAVLVRDTSLRAAAATHAAEEQRADQHLALVATRTTSDLAIAEAKAAAGRAVGEAAAQRDYRIAAAKAYAALYVAQDPLQPAGGSVNSAMQAYATAMGSASDKYASKRRQLDVQYATQFGDALIDRAQDVGAAGIQYAADIASATRHYADVANGWDTTYSILAGEAVRRQTEAWMKLEADREAAYRGSQREWFDGQAQAIQQYLAIAGQGERIYAREQAMAESIYQRHVIDNSAANFAPGFADWIRDVAPEYVKLREREAELATSLAAEQVIADSQYEDHVAGSAIRTAADVHAQRSLFGIKTLEAYRIYQQTMVAADSQLMAAAAYADQTRAISRASAQADYDVQAARSAKAFLVAKAELKSGESSAVVERQQQAELAKLDAALVIADADADLQWTIDVLGAEESHTRTAIASAYMLEQQLAMAERLYGESLASIEAAAERDEAAAAVVWADDAAYATSVWRTSTAQSHLDFRAHALTTQREPILGGASSSLAWNSWPIDAADLMSRVELAGAAATGHVEALGAALIDYVAGMSAANERFQEARIAADYDARIATAAARNLYGQSLVAPAKKLDLVTATAQHDRRVAEAQAEESLVVSGNQQAYQAAIAAAAEDEARAVAIAREDFTRSKAIADSLLDEQLVVAARHQQDAAAAATTQRDHETQQVLARWSAASESASEDLAGTLAMLRLNDDDIRILGQGGDATSNLGARALLTPPDQLFDAVEQRTVATYGFARAPAYVLPTAARSAALPELKVANSETIGEQRVTRVLAQRDPLGAADQEWEAPVLRSERSAVGRFFQDVGLMLRYPGAAMSGAMRGAKTSGKVFVNGSLTTVKSFGTLGFADSPVELIAVTEEDRANGYDLSFSILRVSEELALGALTGKLATTKNSRVPQRIVRGAFAWDMAQNGVSATRGGYGMLSDGVTLYNSIELIGGLAGLGGNTIGRLSDGLFQSRSATEEVLDRTIELGVTLHSPKDKIGHAFVIVDGPDGTRSAYGFYPQDGFMLGDKNDLAGLLGKNGGLPGAVMIESMDMVTDPMTLYKSFRISEESMQRALKFIEQVSDQSEEGLYRYHLASQCATFARQALREAGVKPFIPIAYPPLMYHFMRLFGK